ASRFPGFRVPESMVGVYEENGGVLDADACIGAHLDMALRHGADLRHNEPALGWTADGAGVTVKTAQGSYSASALIVAVGPWTPGILPDLALPLTVWRVANAFFEPSRPEFQVGRCPFYLLEVPEGTYYGLPELPGQGLKAGRHDTGEACTPETARREVSAAEVEDLKRVLDVYMPGAGGKLKGTLTCLYTMTPDEDFIIDRHPQHRQVVYASACSGHGFKFSSAIGEVLSGMALSDYAGYGRGVFEASRLVSADR
ncbi:MAG TPA: FAD-dependent oxidoreductase, partial [Chloroflexia bacterium]|nr:FAD-dependent oxidoreductase [Chloroflexia bacterium]